MCAPTDESVATPVAPQNENPRTATAAISDLDVTQAVSAIAELLVDLVFLIRLKSNSTMALQSDTVLLYMKCYNIINVRRFRTW